MIIYMVNMIIVFFSSYFARMTRTGSGLTKNKGGLGSLYFFLIGFTSLLLVAGLRKDVGTDYPTYHALISTFYKFDFQHLVNGDLEDRGFIAITWLIGRFTQEPQVAFFIFSMIIITFVTLTIKKFGKPFELSMALYISGLAYYSSFNGVRQWIAAAMIFWAVRYLVKGDWVKYFIVVIIASTVHLSALIMIIAYLLVRNKFWKYIAVVLISVFAGMFILYSGFIESMFSFMGDFQYGHYSDVLKSTENGANIFRVFVWAVPIALYYLFKERFDRDWPGVKYVVRLSIIGFLFAVLSIKNASIYRICMYFDIYNILITPRLTTFFDKKINALIYFCIFMCFLLYSYLVIPFDSNLLPYRFFNLFNQEGNAFL